MKKIQSTCNYCAIDCNLDFYVENNRVVKTVPTKGYPVNDGFCCIKGLSLDKQQSTVKPNSLRNCRKRTGRRAWRESAPGSLPWRNLPFSAM